MRFSNLAAGSAKIFVQQEKSSSPSSTATTLAPEVAGFLALYGAE